jgi:hypothetical protein
VRAHGSGGLFTDTAREFDGLGALSCKGLPLRGAVGWVEPDGQPNAAGMSAVDVSYALRDEGRDGHGSAGRTEMAGKPAAAMPAADITTLYRGAVHGNASVFLGDDASRRHLLLAWERNGWIDHGRLRLLPPQGGAAFADAW